MMMMSLLQQHAAIQIRRRLVPRPSMAVVTTISEESRQVLSFSTKQPKKKKGGKQQKETEQQQSYFERKAQRKQMNRLKYENQLSRKQRIMTRRDNAPGRDILKDEFKSWWQPQKAWQEMMDRKARQAGKEWKIQIATVLERLPVVLPDKPEWQNEFDDLQDYLGQFGKEYPKELFPEHHSDEQQIMDDDSTNKFPTSEEELLGKCSFVGGTLPSVVFLICSVFLSSIPHPLFLFAFRSLIAAQF